MTQAGPPRRVVVTGGSGFLGTNLVRALAEAGAVPASTDEIITALRDLKYTVEEQPVAPSRPRQLDVVVAEL